MSATRWLCGVRNITCGLSRESPGPHLARRIAGTLSPTRTWLLDPTVVLLEARPAGGPGDRQYCYAVCLRRLGRTM